ncbi:hypothetical protein MKW92_024482 [Papaver armeniacum]|nr:hypothetical protein MKW92_024482 [Papaver armeniacum]
MATASVTSPLCKWLKQQPSLFESSKRWAASKKRNLLVSRCSNTTSEFSISKGFSSSFCGSLMNSCLAFEHCQDVNRKQKRVVVTGMGVLIPLGHEPDEFYNNLLEGVSGISDIEVFTVPLSPLELLEKSSLFRRVDGLHQNSLKRADKFMLYMLTVGKKALSDGGILEEVMTKLDETRCCVLIGSGMGGMKVFSDAVEALRICYKKINPFWMDRPQLFNLYGCATSIFCILNAPNHITRGEADVMLYGGPDSVIIPLGLGGFVACRALSKRNEDPTKNLDGFVMGEGAGVLLLEELDHAKKQGATIYADFLGGSFASDAYHMTEPHPDGKGTILCIYKALAQSGFRVDVNYVNAHATSTQAGDMKEYQSIIRCFGQNPDLRVFSIKSMIGHLFGAAGAVEAVALVQDTEVLVGPKKERLDIKITLSNSFGFGGHNFIFPMELKDEGISIQFSCLSIRY